jgi:hypothetical protein
MIEIICDDYSGVSNNDYVVFYDRSHPVTNEEIDLNFNLFFRNRRLYESEEYPDFLFVLANEIIRLFNIRQNTRDPVGGELRLRDIRDYIEVSKTLWTKLNNFRINNDFYLETINEEQVEKKLNLIFKANNTITKKDSLITLQEKRANLLSYFFQIKEFYSQILTRLYSYTYRNFFRVQSYERRISKSLELVTSLEYNIIFSFDKEIENRKNVNHRRGVLMQCMNQNFGFSGSNQIDVHLIYKIDSYLSSSSL